MSEMDDVMGEMVQGLTAPDGHERQETAPAGARAPVLSIPALSLVVLIGSSGSGKSTFAARHFLPAEVLSFEHDRAAVADDPGDQAAAGTALDALRYIAGQRLALGHLTVVDATNVEPRDRAALVHIAREHDVVPVSIVLNLDERICVERNRERLDRPFAPRDARDHVQRLRSGLHELAREGFHPVYVLNTPEQVEAARIERTPLYTDRRGEGGPFDLVGDVHGCYDELCELLAALGYREDAQTGMRHPGGRRVIFLGDLVDRGPKVVETVTLVRRMVAAGQALCVPGNHDEKLRRYLIGRPVRIRHGLEASIAQIEALPPEERGVWLRACREFLDGLPSHYVLDGGSLVAAHAGMKERYQGRISDRVRAFALYGETTGESDEFGLPVRGDWAADYRGSAAVVYGHTPVYEPAWVNNTLNIDTGCVFGGRLTALRWPERALVSVPARREYARARRPFLPEGVDAGETRGTDAPDK